jgi:hypothetical protein
MNLFNASLKLGSSCRSHKVLWSHEYKFRNEPLHGHIATFPHLQVRESRAGYPDACDSDICKDVCNISSLNRIPFRDYKFVPQSNYKNTLNLAKTSLEDCFRPQYIESQSRI